MRLTGTAPPLAHRAPTVSRENPLKGRLHWVDDDAPLLVRPAVRCVLLDGRAWGRRTVRHIQGKAALIIEDLHGLPIGRRDELPPLVWSSMQGVLLNKDIAVVRATWYIERLAAVHTHNSDRVRFLDTIGGHETPPLIRAIVCCKLLNGRTVVDRPASHVHAQAAINVVDPHVTGQYGKA